LQGVIYTRYQQIAMLEQETGELIERRLEHESGEARGFYPELAGPVRVGIEATGHTRWFERMLAELGHELWIGDAAQIRASVVRKHLTLFLRRRLDSLTVFRLTASGLQRQGAPST
jgi:hypothetical protein